jgi:outer membrane protein insertion porin family
MSTARALRLVALAVSLARPALGDAASQDGSTRAPALAAAPDLSAYDGKPVVRVDVVSTGGRLPQVEVLKEVRAGQAFSAELARQGVRELLDSGRYAEADVLVDRAGAGVVLRYRVLPRRVVQRVDLLGSPVGRDELLAAAGLRAGEDLTTRDLPHASARLEQALVRRGFPEAKVTARAVDTDDPLNVVLSLEVRAGRPLVIGDRWFGVWPDPKAPGLERALATYDVDVGERADADLLTAADDQLETELRARGFYRAVVGHRVELRSGSALLRVDVQAGPLIVLAFEGNRAFDAATLEGALELDESEERDPAVLADRLRDFYQQHGYLDATVTSEERGAADAGVHALTFVIRERAPVRVVAREYPCLSGERTPAEIGSEIDSFLSDLPGSELIGAVDENVVAELHGPRSGFGRRKPPASSSPWSRYVPDVYDKAIEHLRELFRAQGYLSASVGPPILVRRACDPAAPPGVCRPIGPRLRPPTECRYDAVGLPIDERPADPALSCRPDPRRGTVCEPDAVLHLPIKLGPRTILYDASFEGNREIVEKELADAAALELGAPVSQVELERARRRVMELYAEAGFAFAEVDTALDLSADHTRGRARFVISEREPVTVGRIEVRGARLTSESLIRKRIALTAGGLYRRSLVRLTEERLGQLGVFSSVSVGFEDPYVPARQKVVLVTVEEREPQHIEARPGFSTGEGLRFTFEYGHKNALGEAIQLRVSSQLGYLPNALILEQAVRRKYDELVIVERLERRNTVTVEFPEIGLGPLFRLSVDGVDVRDNARDYGITKDAAIGTVHFRPSRRVSLQAGASLERNDAAIFGRDQKGALEAYVKENPSQRNTFRVPEGKTWAIAQQVRVAWDRRDNPLDATEGTLIALGAEHVHAEPIGGKGAVGGTSVFAPTISDFMRYDGRVAGYLRLSDRGLALAVSFRAGFVQQLIKDSRTYPDRLLFLGGADSVRGFSQDSLIPEDIAQRLLDPSAKLEVSEIVIRGGDAFVNPRAELRIPLTGSVQTALFVDAGNLWTDPRRARPFALRYAAGSGLRVSTPIGPLVFDYGFNADRVLDELFPSREKKRTWESIGAFHFSIGVF